MKWYVSQGINDAKEDKHGGKYYCGDCIDSVRQGGPSGVEYEEIGVNDLILKGEYCRNCMTPVKSTSSQWISRRPTVISQEFHAGNWFNVIPLYYDFCEDIPYSNLTSRFQQLLINGQYEPEDESPELWAELTNELMRGGLLLPQFELRFEYEGVNHHLQIIPEQPDWWISIQSHGKMFDVHYCEDYMDICVYEVHKNAKGEWKPDLNSAVYETALDPAWITAFMSDHDEEEWNSQHTQKMRIESLTPDQKVVRMDLVNKLLKDETLSEEQQLEIVQKLRTWNE